MQIQVTSEIIRNFREKRIFFEVDSSIFRLQENDVLVFSDKSEIEPYCGILSGNSIPTIGSFSYSWSYMPPDMKVGRYCSIAGGMTIPYPRHTPEFLSTSSFMYDKNFSIMKSAISDTSNDSYNNIVHAEQKSMPIIGHDVWIGMNATLMPGITIGNGALIAANSVVTKSVPEFAIVGGNPAKVIKFRFSDDIIYNLNKICWWDYIFTDFKNFDLKNVEQFIEDFYKLDLKKFEPEKIVLRSLLG